VTRGLCSLLHGHPTAAFLLNPLAMITAFGLALYLIYAVLVISANLPRLRCEVLSPRGKIFLRILVVFFITTNWMYLMIHERGTPSLSESNTRTDRFLSRTEKLRSAAIEHFLHGGER
jgi:hypothetical protein